MKQQYILAHDLGTSGNKATLYDLDGQLLTSSFYEYDTFYPKNNWVEQDSEDWWKAVCISTRNLIEKAGISKADILCISFSGQMMGCLPVDKAGNPLRKTIIWADLRSVKQAAFMEDAVGMETVYKITGHRISPAYSAAKILWVKDNQPEIYNKTYKILHAKDYIIYKLTGKFVTDYSDASGTNLLNLEQKDWSETILNAIGLQRGILPELHPSTDIAGKVTKEAAAEVGLLEGTPVVIGGGDGSCAATGAGVVEKGSAYNVIGSSSWIALATETPIFDPGMRTFNWVHLDQNLFSPCGTMQSAGYSYSWLKNTLCGLEINQAKAENVSPYEIINQLIEKSKPGANNVLFLPYLLGERSPRWNPDAKGAFLGLKVTTTKEEIYRSVLEGVTFNLKIILDIFNQFSPIDEVIVIGGGARSKIWMQILADIWQKPVLVPQFLEEATSMGAAICGGVAIGAFNDFKVIKNFNKVVHTVKPRPEYQAMYDQLFAIFNQTYEALVPVYANLAKLEA
ncbi:MAG: xylulokinase [Bacillota bacterium]